MFLNTCIRASSAVPTLSQNSTMHLWPFIVQIYNICQVEWICVILIFVSRTFRITSHKKLLQDNPDSYPDLWTLKFRSFVVFYHSIFWSYQTNHGPHRIALIIKLHNKVLQMKMALEKIRILYCCFALIDHIAVFWCGKLARHRQILVNIHWNDFINK